MTKEEYWNEKKNLLLKEARSYRAFELGIRFSEKRIEELEKENAELKEYNKYLKRKRQGGIQKQYNKVAIIKQQDEHLTKAKEIMNIAIEGIKNWGFVSGTERPFEKQAEKLFNLFLDKAEQFLNSKVEK